MKNLIFIVSAITALSHFAPITGFAEPTHPNEIGLYTTPDGYGATGTDVVWAPVEVYLVLTKPTCLPYGGEPVFNVVTFTCQLNFNPIPNEDLYLQSVELMVSGGNIGDTSNIQQGFYEFMVGFFNFLPVVDETAVLATLTFINLSDSIFEVSLGPCSDPEIPGQMTFASYDCTPHIYQAMYPVSGSFNTPVFLFNGEAVPVETESFGSVKALYR